MKRVTVNDVMAWGPCDNYPIERIEELFAGRESLGWREILETGIPTKDLLWVFLHPEFLSERRMHLLACDFAEAVLHLTDDPRSAEALRVKRLWVDGQATDKELEAAREAAWAVVEGAAWAARAAAWAAWDAAWDAARAAGVAAARAASWDSQLVLVIAALEEEENAETAA
jgi:hypothetical protein